MKRKLTGNWYIKRKLFGFKIMVEIINERFYPESPPHYVCATHQDLVELNIKIYN